jgi:hypothetical protein
MDFVYVLIRGSEWEDIVILLSKEDAINESIIHSNDRVEIFCKTNYKYIPTYNYYQNGILFQQS